MTNTTSDSVLRRKLDAAAPDPALAAAGAPPVERALGLAMARVSGRLMALAAVPEPGAQATRSLAELLDELPENGLYALLDGPGEAQGIMVLDPALMAALIEQQTAGALVATPPAPRRPTRTDAALCADWIDSVLAALGETYAEAAEASWLSGFGFSSHLPDPRPLGLMLEDEPYRVLRFGLDLAGGARRGGGLLALPARGRAPEGRPAPGAAVPEPRGGGAGAGDWGARIEALLMEAEVPQLAVLHRLRRPIADILALAPGDVLTIPASAIGALRLEAVDGSLTARGRLGRSGGFRAVRIGEAGEAEEEDLLGAAMAALDAEEAASGGVGGLPGAAVEALSGPLGLAGPEEPGRLPGVAGMDGEAGMAAGEAGEEAQGLPATDIAGLAGP